MLVSLLFCNIQSQHTLHRVLTTGKLTEAVLTERPTGKLVHGGCRAREARHTVTMSHKVDRVLRRVCDFMWARRKGIGGVDAASWHT